MIARKEWFNRRKYGGWGVSPNCWQGWLYMAFVIIPFIIFQSLSYWTIEIRMTVTILWLAFLFLDIIPVMIFLKRDEREHQIEAISERNAAWFMSLVLVAGVLFELTKSALQQKISVNIFLIIALFGGALVKTISNLILEKRKI